VTGSLGRVQYLACENLLHKSHRFAFGNPCLTCINCRKQGQNKQKLKATAAGAAAAVV